MDPVVNLAEQREAAQRILGLIDEGTPDDADEVAAEIVPLAESLAQLALALDEWRGKGGFDPYVAPDNGRAPTNAQMLAVGRLMRGSEAKTARVYVGAFDVPADWLYLHMPDGKGIVAAGIAPDGSAST